MENNLSKLYEFYRNNALLITKLKRARELYQKQFYCSGGALFTEITNDLTSLEKFPEYLDKQTFQNSFLKIASSVNSEDFALLADSLNSFIYEVMVPIQQALFADLSSYISDIYDSLNALGNGLINIEETAAGHPTLLYRFGKDRYLCSTEDPMLEAFLLAKENFTPEADAYHIWGMGLGFHIYALYQLTHGSTDIYVYDTDSFLFDIARSGKLGPWQDVFNNPRIHLVPDIDITGFSAALTSEKNKCIIHMPSLHKLPEDTRKQSDRKAILKKIQITIISFEEQKHEIYLNFYKNIKNSDGYAEELFPEFNQQNIVIIAAGPSLDKNIEDLKKALNEHTPIKVICVGTVLKKLINIGITPDAFFVMDALMDTYAQIQGVEHLDIPFVLGSSTYYKMAEQYRGKKYIACQKNFHLAEKMGHILFDTGGSVTTLAIDFAIKANAQRIILMGCDMAFTNNLSHTDGTVEKHDTTNNNVIYVKEYYGGTVPSGQLLSLYREWIEKRIQSEDAKKIDLINSTEGGAYIEGMTHIPLCEVINGL